MNYYSCIKRGVNINLEAMDEKIIERLFEQVSSKFDIAPEGAKVFFTLFVKETLAYRDELMANNESPLLVEEVQEALIMLEETLVTKHINEGKPSRALTLLKRWIVKLNEEAKATHG